MFTVVNFGSLMTDIFLKLILNRLVYIKTPKVRKSMAFWFRLKIPGAHCEGIKGESLQ